MFVFFLVLSTVVPALATSTCDINFQISTRIAEEHHKYFNIDIFKTYLTVLLSITPQTILIRQKHAMCHQMYNSDLGSTYTEKP